MGGGGVCNILCYYARERLFPELKFALGYQKVDPVEQKSLIQKNRIFNSQYIYTV